ncbi:hypothetical protein ACFCV9_04330 [Streptomyces sp. NPDC056367]|uniref:hypothetical protein n=1 Tax=Streptomyces sp. NPDC056367 TaxID=3345797 RepID=UPI0035DFB3DF
MRRLRKALALTAVLCATLAATASTGSTALADIGTGGGARPAPALPSRALATCGDGKSAAFPIGARIRGGPAVYRTGGGPQSWYLDLTNTTNSECTAIHPVIVFTDKARALRPAHLRMDFDAPGGPFPVSQERTDRDEIIAVFDGGDAFPGFTVGAGGTLTVKVSLAFAPDAPNGEVVADAALVQRKGDDGDWVGEAGGYRFSVEGPDADGDGDGDSDPGAAGSLAHTGDRDRDAVSVYGAGAVVALAVGGGLVLGARRLRLRTPTR